MSVYVCACVCACECVRVLCACVYACVCVGKVMANLYHPMTFTTGDPTSTELVYVSLDLLETVGDGVEGSEANVPLHLGPRGDLVDGPLATLDLGRLHRRRGCKLVAGFLRMLEVGVVSLSKFNPSHRSRVH